MIELKNEVTPHFKDVLQKYTSALFKDTTLEYFGIKTAKVKEPINVELPGLEIKETRADFIFLLEDGKCVHFEFQTTFNKTVLPRFARYDTRIYDRDKREITTIIVYSADVKKADASLRLGSLTYEPINIMMCEYDGDTVYKELEAKLQSKQELTNTDMLNLIFLPLMKNEIARAELAEKTVEMAKTIEDEAKRKLCEASAVAFADAYLSKEEFKKIWEAIRMNGALAELVNEEVEIKVKETAEKMAIKMIEDNEPIEKIAKYTELDIAMIKKLQKRQLKNKKTT